MMRSFVLVLVLLISVFANAQEGTKVPEVWREGYVLKDASADTLGSRERAKNQRERAISALHALKDKGGIVIRLKTNDKSVEAYRKAGKTDIANRMVQERKVINQKMYAAFTTNVTFCPVYFIYASDSKAFSEGKKVLLNENLERDSTIVMKDTFYVMVEYGTATANGYAIDISGYRHIGPYKDRRFMGEKTVNEYQGNNISEAALVFIDKNYKQYYDPFPFCEGVYLENYNAASVAINKQLYRAYNRLVAIPEIRDEQKRTKREMKAKLKAQ